VFVKLQTNNENTREELKMLTIKAVEWVAVLTRNMMEVRRAGIRRWLLLPYVIIIIIIINYYLLLLLSPSSSLSSPLPPPSSHNKLIWTDLSGIWAFFFYCEFRRYWTCLIVPRCLHTVLFGPQICKLCPVLPGVHGRG